MMIPDRSRILLTLPLLVFATLGLVLAVALLDGNDGTLPSVHVNQPAPGLDLVEMDGHPLLARDDLADPVSRSSISGPAGAHRAGQNIPASWLFPGSASACSV